MSNTIITTSSDKQLTTVGIPSEAGAAANQVAADNVFADYRERKADNTLTAQDNDLARFVAYLHDAKLSSSVDALTTEPTAWTGVTFGIVEGFKRWMLNAGYAISTINRALSTVKKYAGLAFQADAIHADAYAKIKLVMGYSKKEARKVDDKRIEAGNDTRIGDKKSEATRIPNGLENVLKRPHDDTPQAKRDSLLMCLLLELGLRCGEVAGLTVGNVNLESGELTFYRPKVDMVQTHTLPPTLLSAMRAYLPFMPAGDDEKLLRRSIKGGKLGVAGMSERSITYRVQDIGLRYGIENLSAHDCRHFWATKAARNGTPIDRLMQAGGWSSYAMPMRYIEAAKIANEGVKLEDGR